MPFVVLRASLTRITGLTFESHTQNHLAPIVQNAMSDEFTSSSDDGDAFIDHFFQELGSPVKTRKSATPAVESDSCQLPDHSQLPNHPQRPDIATSYQGIVSDAPRHVQSFKKNAPEAAANFSLEIPSIFLTEGERNRRILRQAREISKTLSEEDEKNRARLAALNAEKDKIIQELNDNGSAFLYSWRTDSKIIEDYVHKSLSQDYSMITRRQFYFFDDVEKPRFDDRYIPSSPSLRVALKYCLGSPDLFLKNLRASRIKLSSFLAASLVSVNDLNSLAHVERVFRHAYTEMSHLDNLESLDETFTLPNSWEEPSFLDLMQAIGTRLAKTSASPPIELKLVHYNNHQELLLLRLSIIFHFFVPRLKSKEEQILLLIFFHLSGSDFNLNKMWKENLINIFIAPIFDIIVNEWSRGHGLESLVEEAHRIFTRTVPTLYGEVETQLQKAFEIHFNMLVNLLRLSSSHQNSILVAKKLIFKFLDVKPTGDELSRLAGVIERIGKLGHVSTQHIVSKYRNDVHKNFFRVHLVAELLNVHILDEALQDGQGLLVCYEKLIDCKDSYQRIIGQLTFLSEEDSREKSRISLIISDTYHLLDYIVNVLGMSGILPNRDFFYDK
ncbi:hypothetical protein METBIDRAFT_13599 [Metschnikowia bicuspidata var. bicuspidata NRRL YB-4993]|uniref:Uncharacterized protein n=1 Tax=Metschnikowia bicuspidata var. bicuspidata NRRL YB-4993 TaxID=869754 RepID=A0A1A0H5D7_9ASCO|nr:hypothetical protein METBIDRAFT_13599 [Metschnikowia bicuspidata var. bicuspidata NRRL YB-4993]OBA19299.1 hypothetical protein METBIDRAFT_13599 [Metschnikowia bicuspidata var. bicuspidata NRRL YB-4993]